MFYLKLCLCILWCLLFTTLYLLVIPFIYFSADRFGYWTKGLSWGVRALSGIDATMENPEFLTRHPTIVVVGNHQSAVDVVTYGKFTPPKVVAVGKKEIFRIPIIGWTFALSGGIGLDRSNSSKAIRQLQELVSRMRAGKLCVGILPEGTRNRHPETLLPFKKGAFHLAIDSGAWIVPIVSGPVGTLFDLKKRIARPGVVKMVALEPVSTQGLTREDLKPLMHSIQASMQLEVNRLFGESQ